ncbi:MAG: methionyl-tRNA formyltransferase [Patescibacteria group bacterium]|nr:methionyl-tRNA formyltransferase [Patescibacteria group bacterium]
MSVEPKIIFLGTPDFALPTLRLLIENNLKPEIVITQPDKPAGRGYKMSPPPVKELATEVGIKVIQPNSRQDLTEFFKQNSFDLAVLVAYGMIIPNAVLAASKCGFLNLHPSLLPKYRGSSPIQAAILNGDKVSGVSIIKLTAKMDAGPILAQQEVQILAADTAELLFGKMAKVGAELMVRTVNQCLSGQGLETIQDETQASYTDKINKEAGHVNWTKSASEIYRQFRAFSPWPGLYTFFGGKRLRILNLRVIEDAGDRAPGLTFSVGNGFGVACGHGGVELTKIQPEGKKPMDSHEFILGNREVLGQILK